MSENSLSALSRPCSRARVRGWHGTEFLMIFPTNFSLSPHGQVKDYQFLGLSILTPFFKSWRRVDKVQVQAPPPYGQCAHGNNTFQKRPPLTLCKGTDKYLEKSLPCLFHFKIWNYYPTNFCLFLTSCFSLVGKRRQTVREKMRSCQGGVLHARTKTPNVFLISKAFPFWYGPIFVEKPKVQMHHKSVFFTKA